MQPFNFLVQYPLLSNISYVTLICKRRVIIKRHVIAQFFPNALHTESGLHDEADELIFLANILI